MSPDNFTRTVEGAAAYERLHHGQEAEPPPDYEPCDHANAEDGVCLDCGSPVLLDPDDARDGEW